MIAAYVEARIRRPAPTWGHVVSQSTPVVAFGDASVARVATLGLNPSRVEFLDGSGALLHGSRRRLATHASLGLSDLSNCSDDIVSLILDDCNNYFKNAPYRRWFDRLMPVLEACDASYYDGTAILT